MMHRTTIKQEKSYYNAFVQITGNSCVISHKAAKAIESCIQHGVEILGRTPLSYFTSGVATGFIIK